MTNISLIQPEFTAEEKRCYDAYIRELIRIVNKYGKEALDAIKKAA